MSNEPERPIEERLRAYAKKRRHEAGPPLELHSATRRLLQGEAARQFAKRERLPPSLLPQFKQYWPRLTSAFAILALLALAAWLFLPGRTQRELSLTKNEGRVSKGTIDELKSPPSAVPALAATDADRRADDLKLYYADRQQSQLGLEAGKAQTEKAVALADASVPAEPPNKNAALRNEPRESVTAGSASALGGAVTRSGSDAAGARFGVARDRTLSPGGPAAPTQPSTLGATIVAKTAQPVASDHVLKRKTEDASQAEFGYKSLTVAPTAPGLASRGKDIPVDSLSDGLQKKADSTTQRFSRMVLRSETDRLVFEPSTAKPVLASFQLERNGREVRIVDADGSVYSGFIQAAPVSTPTPIVSASDKNLDKTRGVSEAKPEQKPAKGEAQDQRSQNYLFSVTGTNRSLKEQVIFTGNVIASAGETSFKQTTNAPHGGIAESPTLPADPDPLSSLRSFNSRISGRALIGDRKEIEINAVPVKP